jgi:hypothetical protein
VSILTNRDYSPLTRRSQRLTTTLAKPEEITLVDNHKEAAVTSIIEMCTKLEELTRLILGDNKEQDTLLSSINEDNESKEYDAMTENNNLEEATNYLLFKQ